ncbi:hypothetical protein J3D56_001796 [Erwinia persicina]|nr:hypothetical protein [Erwinia persicina]
MLPPLWFPVVLASRVGRRMTDSAAGFIAGRYFISAPKLTEIAIIPPASARQEGSSR